VLWRCWLGGRKGIRPVKKGHGGAGHWLVRIEWRPAGWCVCLPLLIFPCTIKSRSSLMAPAHPDGPGKRAIKRLCVCVCVFILLLLLSDSRWMAIGYVQERTPRLSGLGPQITGSGLAILVIGVRYGIQPHDSFLWPPCVPDVDIIFLPCGFFSFFSSPNLSRPRCDVGHTCTHGVALVQI